MSGRGKGKGGKAKAKGQVPLQQAGLQFPVGRIHLRRNAAPRQTRRAIIPATCKLAIVTTKSSNKLLSGVGIRPGRVLLPTSRLCSSSKKAEK
nr:histone H2A-like [Penaeus vannamei]